MEAFSAVLADTGAIVALLDRSDTYHDWAVDCFKRLAPPLITCEAVLTESYYLLGFSTASRRALAKLCREDILRVDFDFQSNAHDVWRLLQKYEDTPMDFADGCLVRLSELLSGSIVWTVDSDFTVYRKLGRQKIPLLTP
jgi:predicted nucleic acid-binding protein